MEAEKFWYLPEALDTESERSKKNMAMRIAEGRRMSFTGPARNDVDEDGHLPSSLIIPARIYPL